MLPLGQFKRLDLRPLMRDGREPFPVIRREIDALGVGRGLILVAPFLPSPLVELLEGEGFKSRIERGSHGDWIVYFWREAGTTPD